MYWIQPRCILLPFAFIHYSSHLFWYYFIKCYFLVKIFFSPIIISFKLVVDSAIGSVCTHTHTHAGVLTSRMSTIFNQPNKAKNFQWKSTIDLSACLFYSEKPNSQLLYHSTPKYIGSVRFVFHSFFFFSFLNFLFINLFFAWMVENPLGYGLVSVFSLFWPIVCLAKKMVKKNQRPNQNWNWVIEWESNRPMGNV